jgi:HlyD family secretion protein
MQMKITFRTVFWTAAAIVIVAMLVFAFRPQAVAVDMAEVTRGPMVVAVRDEGRTRVRNDYVVSAPVGGQLLRVPYKAGAAVNAGETVARILPADPAFLDARTRSELAAAVESAEASLAAADAEAERADARLRYARMEVERLELLRARELTSVDALDRARLQLRVAETDLGAAAGSVRMRRAELGAARVRLQQPTAVGDDGAVVEVRAPITGRVLSVTRESSSVIEAGAEIMTLGDPRDLEVLVELLSTDAVEVRDDAPVEIENWGRARMPLRGRVRLVEPYGDLKISALGVEEQRVNVIVDFVDPPEQWASLGHGYRIEAAIETWRGDDVVQVPVSALFRDGNHWAVYRVVSERAEMTPVEVGHDNGRTAEILSGLEAGQTIVLYPGEQVGDGVRVAQRGS